MKRFKNLIKGIPFIMLLMNGVSFVFAQFDIYFIDHWWIHEISGHNLLTLLYMGFFSYYHRACSYVFVSVVSMALLNVLNIIYFFAELPYYNFYGFLIIFTGIGLSIVKMRKENGRS